MAKKKVDKLLDTPIPSNRNFTFMKDNNRGSLLIKKKL